MNLVRRSLIPACAALALTLACENATGPRSPLTVTTSLSRATIVPGDTMTIFVLVTSPTQIVTPQSQPPTCGDPSFVVKNVSGQIVDRGVTVCVAGEPTTTGYPVSSASYTWSAEPYVCDSMLCHRVPLPTGLYSVIGQYQSDVGTIESAPQLVRVTSAM